ncbi:MAG: glycerol kinase GlpK [Defluviitaleaceae bacterium]|nr:glycerol kinase GlpK [Defluviitaleaceae bacterium]
MILSIDQSTSATKGLVWSLDGQLLGRADIPHKQITNADGWVEHDPMEILRNTFEAAKKAMITAKIDFSEIKAIGISNQRETALCWNKTTGLPIYNAIVWQCARATDIIEEVKKAGLEKDVRKNTGLTLSPYFSGAKFGWMIKHIPEAAEIMKNGQLCCGTMDSWLIFKLTGAFKTDYSNASRTQLFDLNTLKWDKSITKAFGLNIECLPEVCMSDSNFGMTDLNGLLPRHVPIHGVLGDSHGALFGNQCFEQFTAKATYGTGSSIMMNAGFTPPTPADGIVTSLAWGMNGKAEYVLEGNINYTGAIIQWLVDDIGLISHAKASGELAKSVEDTRGCYLVPAFTGLGAPYFNSDVRAAWLGMNPATKKAHLVRAAEECIAYQIRDVVEVINQCAQTPISILRADGGPTRDDFLMNFQADILNIPVEISQVEELSGMGAAFCAAIGAGLTDRDTIFSKQTRRKIEPHMNSSTREKLYNGWKTAVDTIRRGTSL